MAAYVVVQVRSVQDPAGLDAYRQQVGATIAQYGGRVRVAGGPATVWEGTWQPALVITEFENATRAQAWYDSEEYRSLKELRQRSATGDMVMVEGV